MKPTEFMNACRTEARKHFATIDSHVFPPFVSLSRYHNTDYLESKPPFRKEVERLAGGGEAVSPTGDKYTRLIYGVEYLITFDPSTVEQQEALQKARTEGVLLYSHLEFNPVRSSEKIVQVHFDLAHELVSYVGYNTPAREKNPSIVMIQEGISLQEGLERFFQETCGKK